MVGCAGQRRLAPLRVRLHVAGVWKYAFKHYLSIWRLCHDCWVCECTLMAAGIRFVLMAPHAVAAAALKIIPVLTFISRVNGLCALREQFNSWLLIWPIVFFMCGSTGTRSATAVHMGSGVCLRSFRLCCGLWVSSKHYACIYNMLSNGY